MQYGYFDNARREYVITDPRTPMPWANYLGSPEYGAIVTQKLCGSIFDERPTAIPSAPCANSKGYFTGSVIGSLLRPS